MSCSKASKEGAIEEEKVSIVLIGKVSYQNVLIAIFTDSSDKNPRRFFFEPVVLLDPKNITCQAHQLFKQEVVRFSIKMWNSEVRSKVRDRIQSLSTFKDLKIHDDDIFVMPYEEVQLVLKLGSSMDQSIQLMDQPITSFHRCSNESLDFYFICDTQLTATTLADNLRQYPDFVLKKWKLALECRGLVLGNEASSKLSPIVTINVSTQPTDEVPPSISHPSPLNKSVDDSQTVKEQRDDIATGSEVKSHIDDEDENEEDDKTKGPDARRLISIVEAFKHQSQDLTSWMLAMPSKRWANAITVFSVKKCRNPSRPKPIRTPRNQPCRRTTGGIFEKTFPNQLRFDDYESITVKEHGDFDNLTGTFTVKTSGLYLLHFSGYYAAICGAMIDIYERAPHFSSSVNLKIVDSSTSIAESIKSDAVRRSKLIKYPPVVVSALLPLKAGDKIGVFADHTWLHESHSCTSRFSAILFSDEFSKQFLPSEEMQTHSETKHVEVEPETRLLSLVQDFKHHNQDLTSWMLAMPNKKWSNAITVFSVKNCRNPSCPLPGSITPPPMSSTTTQSSGDSCTALFPGKLGFDSYESQSNQEHVDVHLPSGTFTIKTSGLYLLHFSGYYDKISALPHQQKSSTAPVELKIDSSISISKSARLALEDTEYLPIAVPVVVSALLPLKAGDKISAFANKMLHEAPPMFTTRFSGILFFDELIQKLVTSQ